jgi:hypothetical protein
MNAAGAAAHLTQHLLLAAAAVLIPGMAVRLLVLGLTHAHLAPPSACR